MSKRTGGRALRSAPLVVMLIVAGPAACAETMSAGVDDRTTTEADAGSGTTFTPTASADGGDAADISVPEAPKLCIATECPANYATCDFSADRCNNNLLNDINNCGACGNKCTTEIYTSPNGVTIDFRHLAPRCVNGQCAVECNTTDFADCNGLLDDGCETSIKGNADNCGGCGIKCAAGDPCIVTSTGQSKCGCPKGSTFCAATNTCVDLNSDDNNCGACGTKCPATSAEGGTLPPNSKYGCAAGTCGDDVNHRKCATLGTSKWQDCDGDLFNATSNGCEANTGFVYDSSSGVVMNLGDPKNCGGCGIACAPGQTCALLREGGVQCACPAGTTMCASNRSTYCADLSSDPLDCGACGNTCIVDDTKKLTGVCNKGVCANECTPGWGDCDGNPDNGCETNLTVNVANCGACGNRCDTAAGQPCIAGQCLMSECDAGVVTK